MLESAEELLVKCIECLLKFVIFMLLTEELYNIDELNH